MSTWITFYCLITLIQLVSSNIKPRCNSNKSPVSGPQPEDETSITCFNANFPTLVSCGFSTKDISGAEDSFGGSWISGNECRAINTAGGAGVYAWARCCSFEQTVTCTEHNGVSANSQDQLSTKQCYTPHIMLGCTGRTRASSTSTSNYFDGSYVGPKHPDEITNYGSNYAYPMSLECTAQDGGSDAGDGATQANINCCTANVGLECNIYYGTPSGGSSELSCPSHQEMMSCSAAENHADANEWYIQTNICKTNSRDNTLVYASAICCNEVTPSPTANPTNNPTPAPTNNPSAAPTQTTSAPTSPTAQPTENPTRTRNPTADPTSNTTAPTSAPSFSPTDSSMDPTTAPSIAPSPAPTRKTRDPTTPPTHEPSAAPTALTSPPTTTTADPNEGGGEKNQGKNALGNNETLYLILFIIFGILFCCLLLGIVYYCWRNKKQRTEVDYNNAHVAVASSPSPLNKHVDASDGIVMSNMEGVNATTTANDGTPGKGTNVIDASVGIKTTTGGNYTKVNNLTTGGTNIDNYVNNLTTMGNSNSPGASPGQNNNAGVDGMSDEEYDNYLKNANEDDQKQDVFKVSM